MWIDAVFSGGGVKGFAFAGALQVLEQAGYEFKRTAGTSAGSIVAALVAAGYTSTDLKRVMSAMDTDKLLEPSRKVRFPFLKWFRFYFKMGLFSGDYLEQWIADLLKVKGIESFSDLPKDCLKIIVSDVSKAKLVVLPDDLPDYGLDPDNFSVAKAVRMSCCLPFFFEPVPLYDVNGQKSLIVDGGVLSNFPLWLYNKEDELPARPFLGLQIIEKEAEFKEYVKIKNAPELFRGLFKAMRNAHDDRTIEKFKGTNIVFLPVDKVKTKDFQISLEERERLFQIGEDGARTFLKKWSY
ncbi:patatin-like phospholipase family protein [Sporolactobacillus kofuensis]|uniref:Patatin-like phospholipase family protein n=1 Tax=Sporolactobacillus kofuensis TaxID=269672 RepID=A0ABW1WGT1_9BACL|nr:patatin-like phospholipase family protein [Sporolactobacillus kofuensis]MCO7176581.1 patatin-like phospholipase family protein [Sporolactobacillus kofuensis]